MRLRRCLKPPSVTTRFRGSNLPERPSLRYPVLLEGRRIMAGVHWITPSSGYATGVQPVWDCARSDRGTARASTPGCSLRYDPGSNRPAGKAPASGLGPKVGRCLSGLKLTDGTRPSDAWALQSTLLCVAIGRVA